MGFPPVYSALSIYLHIPLLALLIGIVLRGTAFTFRHYDAFQDRSQKLYTFTFRISSFLTPLFLGIVAGAAISGRIDPGATTFTEHFIRPWLGWFPFAVGIFLTCICAFLAAVYLITETKIPEEQATFQKAAIISNLATVVAGGFVFVAAEMDGHPLLHEYATSWTGWAAAGLATALLPVLWLALSRKKAAVARIAAAGQIVCVAIGWFAVQFPVMVNHTAGENLTFYNAAAPDSTLLQLLIALVVGSAIIFPSLYFLFYTFKKKQITA
jgi:cytochrome d ubiquinol oxidase subunit II